MKHSPTVRTPAGLRDMLFDELDRFRAGKTTPKHAQVVVHFARSIIDSSRLELIVLHLGEKGGKFLPKA